MGPKTEKEKAWYILNNLKSLTCKMDPGASWPNTMDYTVSYDVTHMDQTLTVKEICGSAVVAIAVSVLETILFTSSDVRMETRSN